MKAKEVVKEYIYKNKLFTDLTEEQAMQVSLIGLPAISRREKKEIYREYCEDLSMDKTRLFRFLFLKHSSSINLKTNLSY
jgi:hypothetical protein